MMGTNRTTVRRTNDIWVQDVEATDDADTSVFFNHGFGVTPDVSLTPLQQAPAAISKWAAISMDRTSVELEKSDAMGSGAVGAQVRVILRRPR